MPASRPDQNPIEPDFWPVAGPGNDWGATWLTSHPLAAWAVACQVLLIGILILVISIDQPIAGTTPVILLLAATGLAALLAPTMRRLMLDQASRDTHTRGMTGGEARHARAIQAAIHPRQAVAPAPSNTDPSRAPVPAPNVVEPSAALIAQICHDLRTPLNAVIGFSSLMAREIHGPVGHPRYQEYVGHIVESGQSLLRSAETTLALTSMLSRPAGIVRERCHLADAVEEAIEMLPPALRTRLATLSEQVPPDATIDADRHGLVHALCHLFMHAVAGAAITPRLTIAVSTAATGHQIIVSVTYEAAPRPAPGTPLAILVARTMLELQGAGLALEPSAHGGWTAIANFPLPPRANV